MIAHETIGNGIEMELSFQPVRDVSQQAESCREVGFIDLGGEDIPLPRTHGIEEVLEVG
jgi:hypothetical protein